MAQVPTLARLHELFEYRDGWLYWKKKPSALARIKIGSIAGTKATGGYWRIKFDGVTYMAHKLIYAYHYNGDFPERLDHADTNKMNNRVDNLRIATTTENAQNVGISKKSTSGIKNVTWSSIKNRWKVLISINGKRRSWLVEDIELAELVAIEARNKFHGSFANHGFKGV